jgi:hypothetical protein
MTDVKNKAAFNVNKDYSLLVNIKNINKIIFKKITFYVFIKETIETNYKF